MKYDISWLKRQLHKEELEFLFFWGHRPERDGSIGKGCLSQWWEVDFVHEGITYKSAEHWMMACKARLFHDEKTLGQILAADSPAAAKRLGRRVQNFNSGKWDANKYAFVLEGNLHKFRQNPRLLAFLLSTEPAILVEAAPNDDIWGIGMAVDSPGVRNPANWQGKNLLGFALTEARDILKAENG